MRINEGTTDLVPQKTKGIVNSLFFNGCKTAKSRFEMKRKKKKGSGAR